MNILVLSIGSNPLPNYIVARYLLMEERNDKEFLPKPDKIVFVFSTKTQKFKRQIVKLLKEDYSNITDELFKEINIEANHRKFGEIHNLVIDEYNKIAEQDKIKSIQYNYTGGTKPMVVAITEATKGFSEINNLKKIILSDLSPDKFKITLRDGKEYPYNESLIELIDIKIKKLFALHDILEPTLKWQVSDFYSTNKYKYLLERRLSDNELKKNTKDNFYCYWDEIDSLKKRDLEEVKSILISTLNDNSLKDFVDYIKAISSNKRFKKDSKLKNIISFIRGQFLEEYIFSLLESTKEKLNITDIAWNVVSRISERDFELDIIVMRGCQVFVISCTTDSSVPICKGKAFEVNYRASLIGGGQAKSILVCLGHNNHKDKEDRNIQNIELDMKQFDAEQNFYLIDKDLIIDESKLIEKFTDIFKGV